MSNAMKNSYNPVNDLLLIDISELIKCVGAIR